jgi:hypothetical protein
MGSGEGDAIVLTSCRVVVFTKVGMGRLNQIAAFCELLERQIMQVPFRAFEERCVDAQRPSFFVDRRRPAKAVH